MEHYYIYQQDALDLLLSRGLPEKVILHCKAVSDTSGVLADELNKRGFFLDVPLCVRAGLLHDVERTKQDHELAGAYLLRERGMEREADIVEHHMGAGIDYTAVTEREVVFLADKITAEHHRTTVRERYTPALFMTEHLPEVHAKIEAILKNCEEMEALYEKILGYSLQDLPIGKMTNKSDFLWNDQTIEWMGAAARHSNYYKHLARHIRELLPCSPRLLDMGCGAGFLTRELAVFASSVTAVDINERAISEVRQLGLKNVNAHCCDANTFSRQNRKGFDAVIYCYYGEDEEILRAVQEGLCGLVIAIGSVTDRHNFSSEGVVRKRCFLSLLELLERREIAYDLKKFNLDFSQPVSSFAEAMKFHSHYSGRSRALSEQEIKKRLTLSCEGEHPYIIPAVRDIGIAAIRCERGA